MERSRWLSAAIVAVLALSACSGSTPQASLTEPIFGPETVEPTVPADGAPTREAERSPAATAAPIATPTPMTDEALIELAMGSYLDDPVPAAVLGADLVEATVRDDGIVSLTVCVWTGTVFDDVREILYRVRTDRSGIVSPPISSAPTAGECLNTALIESVMTAVATHDNYWSEVLATPSEFADDELGTEIFMPDLHDVLIDLTRGWAEDDVVFVGSSYDGELPESAVAEVLYRRYRGDTPIFAIQVCREMQADYGLYRDDVLINDYRDANSIGSHSATEYQLVRDPRTDLGWKFLAVKPTIWADCFATGDWLGAVNTWKPDPVGWEVWER